MFPLYTLYKPKSANVLCFLIKREYALIRKRHFHCVVDILDTFLWVKTHLNPLWTYIFI